MRSLDDTGKHLIRILRQGGQAANTLSDALSDGRDSIIKKVVKAMNTRPRPTPAQIEGLVHSEVGKLLKSNERIMIDAGMVAGEFQAKSSAGYLAVLGVKSPSIYNVTETFVKRSFKKPFPEQNVSVNDLLTGQMAQLDTQIVNVTRRAISEGEPIRSTAKFIERASEQLSDSTLRRKANALARTAIAQVANDVRFTAFDREKEVSGVLYVATLDHRTSNICKALDGTHYPTKEKARIPPLHVGCRSTLVPILKGEKLSEVKDQLRRPAVEIKSVDDLEKKGLKTSGGKVRKPSRTGRSPLKGVQKQSYMTYEQWLKAQPVAYQTEILGPKAYRKFRESGDLKRALGFAE